MIREDFELKVGEAFSFEMLESREDETCLAVVQYGKSLFSAIAELYAL
jgi:hypothetical protein